MIKARALVTSIWDWEHWKKASVKSGAYILHDAWTEHNMVVDEGLTHLMETVFSGGAQKTAWYIALFNDDYTVLAANTYQSPGYTESTNYAGSRKTWVEAGVSAKSISNAASVALFTMSASETIYGASLLSANTPGDAVSGETLYCSSKFTTGRGVEVTDVLKVTATLTAEDVV